LKKKANANIEGAANQSEGWKYYSETSSNIKVYTFDNPDGSRGVCGVGVIAASPQRVRQEITNVKNWPSWDPLFKSVEFKELGDHTKIFHLTFHGIWPYNPRDLVYFETSTKGSDGSLILGTMGVDFPSFPITDEYVRAELVGGGWHMRPIPNHSDMCVVTYFMNTDPKLAFIPYFIMNMAVTRFPNIIDTVRQAIVKKEKDQSAKITKTMLFVSI